MRLEDKGKNILEKKIAEGSDEIMEASELLYEIINASYMCSRDCLETTIHDHRETVQSLYWACKERMKQAEKGGEKTLFLIMSILEDTFRKVLPLLLVRVEDLADGNFRQVEAVRELKAVFRDNVYRKMWEEKAEIYQQMLKSIGFPVKVDDYRDLTLIMEPLLDALTLYSGDGVRRAPKIFKVRDGERSQMMPTIITDMCKYHSEKEFVDAITGCGKESVIAFGAVEKKNWQIQDAFQQWFDGFPEERMRNSMKNLHMTEEEYLNEVVNSTRTVWLCVKSGQTVWLMQMPYNTDSYADLSDSGSQYYYGKRAGYAPYAIFYKDLPIEPKDSTFLSIPRKGYALGELMDDMQRIWFPVFLNETIEKFFRSEPDSEHQYFPEELRAVIEKKDGEALEIVPVTREMPSVCVSSLTFEVPAPKEVFGGEAYMEKLIEHFHVTREDLADVPLLPHKRGNREELEEAFKKQVKKAYLKVLGIRITEYMQQAKSIRAWIVDDILLGIHDIQSIVFQALKSGAFDSFRTTIIDGRTILNEDGSPKMIDNPKTFSYSRKEHRYVTLPDKIPEKEYTSVYDRKSFSSHNMKESCYPVIYWAGEKSAAKPPVLIKIRPKKKEDYQKFFRAVGEDMPEFFNLIDEIDMFRKHNKFMDYIKDVEIEDHFHMCFANINVCMTKKVFKQSFAEMEK